MNCTNCGGAMELVESRRYFTCRHCGSSRFPEPIESDGIRLIAGTTTGLLCPLCHTALTHALLHDAPVDICTACRGLLLPREAFSELVHSQRSWATSPPVMPSPLNPRALERKLSCPKCGGALETYPYGGPGNAVIDGCRHCDVIWLDFGEFRQIVDAPGRDRGRP
jgi:Zn-finger nucleic acid-binding protein